MSTPGLETWALEQLDLEVLGLLATGLTVAAVAHRLHLSERTVRRRLNGIRAGLEVDSTVEAVVRAARLGLI